MTITPVLLCGGLGARLWPLSRARFPKQFADLLGSESLFQAAARRLSGPAYAPPLVVTGPDFRFIVTEQLAECGIEPGTVLVEPEGRNTGPAILAAALHLAKSDADALMLAAPSDHAIPDAAAFDAAVGRVRATAADGGIVAFGVAARRPETGYGYLEPARPPCDGVAPVARFVEKPDAAKAAAMLARGNVLWNAGIFLFSARTILDAFAAHAPSLVAPVRRAVDGMRRDLDFFRLAPAPWAEAQDISVDHAVMERADNLFVAPFDGAWSDLGGWDAVLRASQTDADGVATRGPATAIDCARTLLRSDSGGQELVGIGLEDTLVVAAADAVLVADASRAQDVWQAVAALQAKGARQATEFARDRRPWGWFETLALADRFQVKRIVVKPGAALSLQSHAHRAEHWVVVEGTARVTIGETVRSVAENQSVYIPLGARHRLENPGETPLVVIEVQTGDYLGEDDIVRHEDMYARGQGAKG